MPRDHHAHDAQLVVHVRPVHSWSDVDRLPNVPTLEEIEIADQLRHDLELKYLGKADPCWDSSVAHSRRSADEEA